MAERDDADEVVRCGGDRFREGRLAASAEATSSEAGNGLGTAEGAGEFSPLEKARFYRMAKRSATEAAAQVIVASRLQLTSDTDVPKARKLLHRVVSMLGPLRAH